MIFSPEDERKSSLDLEWLQLLLEAKRIGLTPKEVRDFIMLNKNK
ncbi:DNA-binding anti-repressor SinI [Halalkalibacter krulwichiae]|uniref:Anti-repressor SinI n=1 Tax=Halalkalibacter krulwichiae TaxID=199441 RepID=A0A1X9MAN7_9BACI|nr:DNA-binding anti-repressor SinI [Halalkalibacter krulwichiae]ARK30468.1 Anti-repressor SinI [Halalkalibacter krulwichiae]